MSADCLPAVAIAGCGALTAVGCGVPALLSALRANASGLHPCERFQTVRCQSSVVGAATFQDHSDEPRRVDDPAWELATKALIEARRQARGLLDKVPASRTALVLSTTKANIEALERLTDGRPCSDSAQRHLRADLLAQDLASAHGAAGPVHCVSAACASGLIAMGQGAKLIQRGVADAALVVGVDHLSAFVMMGFSALKALDPAGCRPFDQHRSGLSAGEAGAAIVLARAPLLRQYGGRIENSAILVRAWGGSNDANHLTGPSRDGCGLAQAVQSALDRANLRPCDIDYIHAHATGTIYNDATESFALRKVFADSCPPVSGSKGMLGHTLGAAGVVESIVCVLAMEHGFIPGTPRLELPAQGTPASLVRDPRPVSDLRHVLKINTGFGGINSALLLSR